MKTAIKKYLAGVAMALLVVGSSCTKDFETINTNPNTSSHAKPETFLKGALHATVSANVKRAHHLSNELMQDQVSISNTQQMHRYIILPSESNSVWNDWYIQLGNFRSMYDNAVGIGDKQFMGIALICDVWVSSMITDCFGDVPYSEACDGQDGILQPRFDTQRDIYASLFLKLEKANTLLSSTVAADTMTSSQAALDPLYNGDKLKWRKFGNSLYLRLLMRSSGKDVSISYPEVAGDTITLSNREKIKHIVENSSAYPVFTSNTESAILKFTTTIPLTSPFYGGRDYDFNGTNGLSEFFIQTLQLWNDPRLPRWATQATLGVYAGIPAGYPSAETPEIASAWNITLKEKEPLLGNIINFAELQFILAEASVRGFIDNTKALYYYNQGVQNAITLWGYASPDNTYLTKAEITFAESADQETKLRKILTQKYFTLLFTGMQQWHEYLRTGYPVLYPLKDNSLGTKMPQRLVYPAYIQSLNRTNYDNAVTNMGGDTNNTILWWQKP